MFKNPFLMKYEKIRKSHFYCTIYSQTHPFFFIDITILNKFFLFLLIFKIIILLLPYGADGKKTEELFQYFAKASYSNKTLLFSPVLHLLFSTLFSLISVKYKYASLKLTTQLKVIYDK